MEGKILNVEIINPKHPHYRTFGEIAVDENDMVKVIKTDGKEMVQIKLIDSPLNISGCYAEWDVIREIS